MQQRGSKLKIGVLTGGGDAPGLNAAICGLGRRLVGAGHTVLGFRRGWRGVIQDDYSLLNMPVLSDLIAKGGTILGCSSDNPYWDKERDLPKVKATFARHDLHAMVVIGGDGTLSAAQRLYAEENLPVVGVPKTIDNDLCGTDFTFGFFTAVERVTQAIDELRTTAESHERVMVVECMGRHAGWITAYAGVAAAAEGILVPERPAELRELFERLASLRRDGRRSAVVSVAEGARIFLDGQLLSSNEKDRFGGYITGGVAKLVANKIQEHIGWEARSVELGHLQRAGKPLAFDRIFALRLGAKAAHLVLENEFGRMAALKNGEVVDVPLAEAVAHIRHLSDHFLDRYDNFFSPISAP